MNEPCVFVVDDEEAICDSTALLLKSVGLKARTYTDPRAFLKEYTPEQPGCLVMDVRMPGVSGLEVQQELNRRKSPLPVIFISGHGDVPMAVEAMRAGALDFLQKPFKHDELIRRVQKALEQDTRDRDLLRQRDVIQQRWDALTPREQQAADLIVDGKANKVVAAELQISERTVELHRAHVMEKMGARSLAQLVQLVLKLRSGA
jgi:two-component system response regulator FixJ